jgi:hypothetical protein
MASTFFPVKLAGSLYNQTHFTVESPIIAQFTENTTVQKILEISQSVSRAVNQQ